LARVLGVLGNCRRDGYTVKVLKAALDGARSVQGVETELVHLLDYTFGPCTSCYHCIRTAEHRCILPDDMGRNGEGTLWRMVEAANGLILASPVHFWTADALMHTFVERLYPFVWSGELKGMPVATIAVASNQGFQIIANRMLCQWAFTLAMRYVGGLPVHAAYLEEALLDAKYLGLKLGEAALNDARAGRRPPTDLERWLEYQDKPWKVYPHYIENLTMGTFNSDFSLIRRAISQGRFKKTEAIELLRRADEEFERFTHYQSIGNRERAIEHLVKASALWTHATWKEFLEEKLIKAPPPKAYHPIEE